MNRTLRHLEGWCNPSQRFVLLAEGLDSEAGAGEASHQPVEGEPESEGPRTAGDTGASHMIPKSRFDEVNAKLKAFKELGSPEEIRRALERLRWLEQNPGKRFTDQEAEQIERELLQVPRFARIASVADRMEAFLQRQSKAYIAEGNRRTEKFLADLGREVNEKNLVALTNALSGIISSDESLMERFLGFDPTVFDDAFKVFKTGLIGDAKNPPGASLQAKKQPAKPAKPAQAAQAAPVKEPKKDLTEREILDEAGDAAYELLMQHQE
jgi:hypothetical protein